MKKISGGKMTAYFEHCKENYEKYIKETQILEKDFQRDIHRNKNLRIIDTDGKSHRIGSVTELKEFITEAEQLRMIYHHNQGIMMQFLPPKKDVMQNNFDYDPDYHMEIDLKTNLFKFSCVQPYIELKNLGKENAKGNYIFSTAEIDLENKEVKSFQAAEKIGEKYEHNFTSDKERDKQLAKLLLDKTVKSTPGKNPEELYKNLFSIIEKNVTKLEDQATKFGNVIAAAIKSGETPKLGEKLGFWPEGIEYNQDEFKNYTESLKSYFKEFKIKDVEKNTMENFCFKHNVYDFSYLQTITEERKFEDHTPNRYNIIQQKDLEKIADFLSDADNRQAFQNVLASNKNLSVVRDDKNVKDVIVYSPSEENKERINSIFDSFKKIDQSKEVDYNKFSTNQKVAFVLSTIIPIIGNIVAYLVIKEQNKKALKDSEEKLSKLKDILPDHIKENVLNISTDAQEMGTNNKFSWVERLKSTTIQPIDQKVR